jgi:hypothetical protein
MLKLTRSASEGERFPRLVIVGVLERSPSLALRVSFVIASNHARSSSQMAYLRIE